MVHRTGYLVSYLVYGFLILASISPLKAQYLYTQAGAGLGDNLSPLEIGITPTFLCTDNQNNIYFTDANSHLVRMIRSSDSLSELVAGLGLPGPADDSVLARQAFLKTPSGIVYSPSENVIYIADSDNHCIRRLNLNSTPHTITRFAGTGVPGNVGDNGFASQAQLRNPFGLAIGPDSNLYIVDRGNSCIRKVDLSTRLIETIAGTGSVGFFQEPQFARLSPLNKPQDICFDTAGNLYISDTGNDRICRVNVSDSMMITLAGHPTNKGAETDGNPALVNLNAPAGLAFEAPDKLWFTDRLNHRIQILNLTNNTIITQVGNGNAEYNGNGLVATSATVNSPLGIAFDANQDIIIADQFNFRIRSLKKDDSSIQTIAGNGFSRFSGDMGPAESSMLQFPEGLASDSDGNLFITDKVNHRIRRVDALTGLIETIAGTGQAGYSGDGQDARLAALQYPSDVAVYADSLLYIADSFNDCIREVNLASQIIRTIAGGMGAGFAGDNDSPAMQALFRNPRGIALDSVGNLFIADELNHRIRRLSQAGTIRTVVGNGVPGFSGDGADPGSASLRFPSDVWVDDQGALWIADRGNHRIRKVNTRGDTLITVAGNGLQGFSGDLGPADQASLNIPFSLLAKNDTLYFSDSNNHRIRQVDLRTGILTSKIGTGLPSFNGDTLLSSDANLSFPTGIALEPSGKLYFSDQDYHRVRLVTSQKPPCQIEYIEALLSSACDSFSNLYTQDLRVWHQFAPTQGQLLVNGQAFAIENSPQDITLINLRSDSLFVDVEVFFDAEPSCRYFQANVFQAPDSCEIPEPVFDSLRVINFNDPSIFLTAFKDTTALQDVDLAFLPDSLNFLIPDPDGFIGSVYWKITDPGGAVEEVWDNTSPFQFSEDSPFLIPIDYLDGIYTFEIQTFSGADGTGRPGDVKTYNLQFTYLPSTVNTISLVDAQKNEVVAAYSNILPDSIPTIIDLDEAPRLINIQANVNPPVVDEVNFYIDLEDKNFKNSENVVPYALFGDRRGNFNSWNPPPFPDTEYVLRIVPRYIHIDEDNSHIIDGDSTIFRFIFTTDEAPEIVSYTVTNARDSSVLNAYNPLESNQIIVRDNLDPNTELNIRVNTFPRRVGGILINLRNQDSSLNFVNEDTTFTYSLYAYDTLASPPIVDIRNYPNEDLTITATPFIIVSGSRLYGDPLSLVFRYGDEISPDPPSNLIIAPNPAQDFLSLSPESSFPGKKTLSIYNQLGELVASKAWESEERVEMDIRNLGSGIYTIRIDHSKGSYRYRFVKQ